MNKLIIVESPNKIQSINGYLKELQKEGHFTDVEFSVEASVGHVLELPKSWEPKKKEDILKFEKKIIRGKTKDVKALKAKAKKADEVLVATDPDREGEAIAQDLVDILGVEKKHKRMVFNEITKDSIKDALENLSTINTAMVSSQQARMVLDRVFGYKLSKWVKQKIWNERAVSSGRVQSPTLSLVVEREFQIEGFLPEKYYKVEQVINGDLIAPIVLDEKNVDGKSNLLDPKYYDEFNDKLSGRLVVDEVKTSQLKGRSRIPFKQSAVYRSAASLGMSATAARGAMQMLFEKGYISYPRTDSTRYSTTFIKKAQAYIKGKFGDEYIAKEIKGTKSGSQDAHEALRITNPNTTPQSIESKLSSSQYRMYKLIYNHTLQSLMVPPVRESLSYILMDNGVKFKLSTSKVIFDGYLKVSGWEVSKELPKLNKGDSIVADKVEFTKGETKPKSRYNEGSLIEAMEDAGIGRPSTFSSTVNLLQKRGYVVKDGNALRATRLGKVVSLLLTLYFGNIVRINYTDDLERILDEVSKGTKKAEDVLHGFWDKFIGELESAVIKRKRNLNDDTQYISLKDLNKAEAKETKDVEVEDSEKYAREYRDLLIAFVQYIAINKRDIDVDYDKFIQEEFVNFLGPVIMPKPPKRGPYIMKDGEVVHFKKVEEYPDAEMCPVCNKHPKIFRGTVSKRYGVSWFKTCSGFPKVKCNFIENIDKEDPINERLENIYNERIAEYKEDAIREAQEATQEINLNDSTQQILLSDL